jgi:hypothetical protein
MEPQIRHVRFFNGQFLRQDEFNEEQGYANHMRRRLNYTLFEDGVVEVTPTDLTIAPVTPGTATDKRVRVRRGIAIGANEDVLEGREVILREDSGIVDLAATFAAGDMVWATVNYLRTPTVPVAVGSGTQNSRYEESAEIRFHAADPTGTLTADQDPLIVIGTIPFDSMEPSATGRQVARLRASLLPSAASISVSPSNVSANTTVTMTITSSGGYDLSGLTPAMVSFSDATNLVLPVQIIGTPTASSAVVRFQIQAGAAAGTRQINVNNGSGPESDDFTINAFVPAPTVTVGTFPASIAPNGLIVIDGTNFIAPVRVRYNVNGTEETTFANSGESVTPTQIRMRAPSAPIGSGTLTIFAAGGQVDTPTINIA